MENQSTKKCLTCGVVIVRKDFENPLRYSQRKFCSRKCLGPYLAVEFKGRPAMNGHKVWPKGKAHPLYKERIERICRVCSKHFFVRPSDMIAGKREKNPAIYCSRKCFGLGRRGPNSPVWKGGKLSDEQYLRTRLHMMPEHKEWHAAVLRRDNWHCVLCGTPSNGKRNLEVDHIKSISVIIKEHGLETTEQARDCQELWDIANGRTLCKPCHRQTANWGRQKADTLTNN